MRCSFLKRTVFQFSPRLRLPTSSNLQFCAACPAATHRTQRSAHRFIFMTSLQLRGQEVMLSGPHFAHMGSSLKLGTFWGPFYKGAVLYLGSKTGTLIWRTTHMLSTLSPKTSRPCLGASGRSTTCLKSVLHWYYGLKMCKLEA